MKTPLAKRWPIALALFIGLILADVSSHSVWIRIVVFVVVLTAAALCLRFVIGWPWSRILRYREPESR